jgi:ABC-type dipeptide/oligopeptide/nickel transport system ATPase component
MSYRAGTPEVLHGVSFAVRGGEKVGVVGRTGSGKSSLMVSLFRLIEDGCHSGRILLDGVDVDGLEGLADSLVEQADKVDHRVRALHRPGDRGRVPDIGLDHLDLPDIAHQAHLVGQVRLAHRHPDPGALTGQGPDDLGSDETGTAEHGDEVWHDFWAPRGETGPWG